MAIAFDASASGAQEVGVTSKSWTHTCTGSNRVLLAIVYQSISADNTDRVTGVTYAGTSMTRINTTAAGTNTRLYLYGLLAPATGANTITASFSVSVNPGGASGSYTGVAQTGLPDSQNTGTVASGTSISVSTTTVADNAWLAGGSSLQSPDTITAGANTTQRAVQDAGAGNNKFDFIDSNAAKTPPGSFSLAISVGAATALGMCIASLAPALGSGPINLLGVG